MSAYPALAPISSLHSTSNLVRPMVPAMARALLARVSIFRGLEPQALDDLSRRLLPRQFRSGAVICAQRQTGDALHILQGGKVKVAVIGESGREVILSVLRPGDFFGEMSLCDGGLHSADVIALSPATILSLPRESFRSYLSQHPQIAVALLEEMTRRLRAADETIVNLAIYEVSERLVRTLCSLARSDGESIDAGLLLRRRPTQQDLASMVGSCRETVSRAFSSLSRRGLIIARGRSLVLTPRLVEMSKAG